MADKEAEAPLLALGQIIRRQATVEALRADPTGTLRSLGVNPADSEAMLALGLKRLLAYDTMAVDRLRHNVEEFCPRSCARLGERLDAQVRTWLDEVGPRSPYFRDLAREFVSWAQPRWAEDASLPPWLGDLAEHELVEFEVRNDEAEIGDAADPMDVSRPVALNGTLRLMRYAAAVHRIARDDTKSVPEVGSFAVLALRGRDEKAHFVTLQERAAHMVERLMAGSTLGESIAYACAQLGEELSDDVLAVIAPTLATLQDADVILGAA